MGEGPAHDLADRVRRGVDALKQGRPAEAVDALEPVATDPAFETQGDLADIRARVWSLLAQALLEAGRPHEADPWARRALQAVTDLGDEQGEQAVRALHQRIFAAATDLHRQRTAIERVASTDVDELLAGAEGPQERAGVLVEKANAEARVGRAAAATDLARRALAIARGADAAREQVLALLVLAEAQPDEASGHLHAAWAIAEAADESTLVGAVARAAGTAGVRLPTLEGPSVPDPSASSPRTDQEKS